jgi:LTXXQ motif family protein
MTNVIRMIIGLTVLGAPLVAQQPTRPDSMGHMMMGPGAMPGMMMDDPMMRRMGSVMMKMMLYTPQHLLARKDALGLTPDQVSRLTALRDGAKATREAAMAEAATHLTELEQAANAASPDTATLKTHFQAAHNAMGKAHWTMLVSSAQARGVLTDAQRAKLQSWADSMQAWTEQHRKMMNPAPARPH